MPNGTVTSGWSQLYRRRPHRLLHRKQRNSWTAGPDFPGNLNIADGPGALEVNGNVLMMASPGFGDTGAEFFEWNGSTLNETAGPPNGPSDSSYYGHMLMLPTGQILFTDFSNDVELFTSTGSQYTGWTPTALLPATTFNKGQTYTISGSKFNGASQDGAYGDDFQDATNYPLIRFVSTSTGQVYYARTHDHSTMAVGYPGTDLHPRRHSGQHSDRRIQHADRSERYFLRELPGCHSLTSCKVMEDCNLTGAHPTPRSGRGASFLWVKSASSRARLTWRDGSADASTIGSAFDFS